MFTHRLTLSLFVTAILSLSSFPATAASIVTVWNNAALAEIRATKLGPPIVARALAIAHTCMYNAWAPYDAVAIATQGPTVRQPEALRTDANKTQAISLAAYHCLVNLFPDATARLAAVLASVGSSPSDSSTPAALGTLAAHAVIAACAHDGANQYGDLAPGAYADYTGYMPLNAPLGYCTPGLAGCSGPDVNVLTHWQPLIGPPELGNVTQVFIAPHWERVTPFALTGADQFDAQIPPSPTLTDIAQYRARADAILAYSAGLTDAQKLSVEFWADGPASELPPGHWGLFAQFVSERDHYSLDQDMKLFFALHNASFDAGIVAWHVKRQTDGVRPITAIRSLYRGQLVFAWGGPGRPTEAIHGEQWVPYNPGSNLTPAFPGYLSGHSIFSSASAAVLRQFTGSDHFGYRVIIPANFGRVEPGIPAVETEVTFATFTEAADAAGMSRLYGGIHFEEDNIVGRAVGTLIGEQAWSRAQLYFVGQE